MMLNLIYKETGILFTDERIPFKNFDKAIYFALSNLIDNGEAELIDNYSCFVPYENIYHLDDYEKHVLLLPETYNKAVRLNAKGTLNESTVQYSIDLMEYALDGELFNYDSTTGNIVYINAKPFMLNEACYNLFKEVNDFNKTDIQKKSLSYNLQRFKTIKELAYKANCYLDDYINSENVFTPQKVELTIGQDINGIFVKPSIEHELSNNFTRSFERSIRINDVYPVQNEKGERTRIVLNEAQKTGLKELHKRRCYFKLDEIKKLTENPTEFFDPDLFDLKEFYSDRVIELGLYKPKFYPFICKYKSDWANIESCVFGARVETRENGSSVIKIENKSRLLQLEKAIDKAKEENHNTVTFDDTEIAIEDALFLATQAKKQLANPSTPISNKDGYIEDKRVLIIKENTEDLEYTENNVSLKETDH